MQRENRDHYRTSRPSRDGERSVRRSGSYDGRMPGRRQVESEYDRYRTAYSEQSGREGLPAAGLRAVPAYPHSAAATRSSTSAPRRRRRTSGQAGLCRAAGIAARPVCGCRGFHLWVHPP